MEARSKTETPAAVIRVEQLYPFPTEQLDEIFGRYPNAKDIVWTQEEPENMGAWAFINARSSAFLPEGARLSHVSRLESGSPATGSARIHEQEQRQLIEDSLKL